MRNLFYVLNQSKFFRVGLVLSQKVIPKSYPQVSDVKNLSRRVIQNFFIQINATLYQRNDAMPLYIKNDKVFHSFSTPLYVKEMTLRHFL